MERLSDYYRYVAEKESAALELATLKARTPVMGGDAKIEIDKAFDLASAKIERAGRAMVRENEAVEKWDGAKVEAEAAFCEMRAALGSLLMRLMRHERTQTTDIHGGGVEAAAQRAVDALELEQQSKRAASATKTVY
jgi:hypothetical protein